MKKSVKMRQSALVCDGRSANAVTEGRYPLPYSAKEVGESHHRKQI